MFVDFAHQISGFLFKFAQAIFGRQLILDVAQNEAIPSAALQLEARNTGLGREPSTIAANHIESPWHPGERSSYAIEFLCYGAQLLSAGRTQQRSHFVICKSLP